jgi:hypothetical protein
MWLPDQIAMMTNSSPLGKKHGVNIIWGMSQDIITYLGNISDNNVSPPLERAKIPSRKVTGPVR